MAGWHIWNPGVAYVSRPSMATQVYYRFAWADTWTWLPDAWCTEIADRVAPSAGSASITHEFGVILPPGLTSAVEYPPAGLLGAYVLIEGVNAFGQFPLWAGVIVQEDTRVAGNVTPPSGTQQYMAVTLDHLLDRVEIHGAQTISGQTDRPLSMNAEGGFSGGVTPNLVIDVEGWPVFGRASDGAIFWTHRAAVDYLMHWFGPPGVYWELADAAYVEQLGMLPPKNYEGYTVKQALDDIFDRRRGLGWCVRVDAVANIARIHVFSQLAESLVVGDILIPANPAQTDVFYDGVVDADPIFRFSEVTYFDAVHVVGGPVYATLTFDESIMTRAGVDTETTEQAEGEDMRITRAASYELRQDWDWTAGGYNASPGVLPDGELDGVAYPDVYNHVRALERQLPFPGVSGEPRAAMALVYVDDKWQLAERAKAADVSAPLGVRLMDNSPGFAFVYSEPAEGAQSPLPAAGHWLLTATLETDRRLGVKVALAGGAETPHIKVISAPEAIAHWVLPGTVLDVSAQGALIRYDGDATYYSDAPMLRNVAALAAAWYGRRRATLDLVVHGITFEYLPGALIRENRTAWFSVPVETVVTERVWDFRNQTTVVKTSYDELAITEMIS